MSEKKMTVKKRPYQICTNCVMDTSDSKIVFDENGRCDFCGDFYENIRPNWKTGAAGEKALEEISAKIKKSGKGKKYDCIIGMSGGVDSSYLCYVAKELMGLRPLIYCVDTGWNLDIAVQNIERIIKALELDLYTEVINWEEMRDLQLAFFRSQVPYQDLPQDHAIFAGLYNYAVKNGIKYVLTGANNATECIRPPIEWVYQNDITLIKDIHRKFGKTPLATFPMCGLLKSRLYYRYLRGMKRVAPLNMIDYDKQKAQAFLYERFGWERYENKHYENVFTRFYEGYYLPHKFGYDKRRCYFSNEILTGTMMREQALEALKDLPYDEGQMQKDKEYIAQKLGVSLKEFDEIIAGENKTFADYKNSWWLIQLGTIALRAIGAENKKYR
ncbi:N-acetyl sugar amidotransferase [Anaerofilum sp. BX8]|uniref:N-acetyl sugar amidotransferase n=1 Tax=Anaerofilum hominis TaxID=2763016 RepID=A0A923I7D8_9FIRM|nr:N-acetyl sugar amidotransferase [Anaerofilum hominis]MBC5581179.1 N-acetyl sugar amidotransferase [Anaerofilum hominis]